MQILLPYSDAIPLRDGIARSTIYLVAASAGLAGCVFVAGPGWAGLVAAGSWVGGCILRVFLGVSMDGFAAAGCVLAVELVVAVWAEILTVMSAAAISSDRCLIFFMIFWFLI
jgi:hypothetical protein